MPQALDVDWSKVKLLALQVGVREAARQCGLSEDTVIARSSREGWMADKQWLQESRAALQERQGVQSVSTRIEETLASYGKESRLNHGKVASKISKKLSETEPDELLMNMPNVLAAGKHAALTFGWQAGQGGTSVRLDLLAGTLEMTSQTVQEGLSDSLEIPE